MKGCNTYTYHLASDLVYKGRHFGILGEKKPIKKWWFICPVKFEKFIATEVHKGSAFVYKKSQILQKINN